MIPPPDELITRDALDRVENNSAANLGAVEKRLEEKVNAEMKLMREELETECRLRTLTERLGKEALEKASSFITEKTEEHNNLLQEMRLDRANFVTKDDLEKEKAAQKSHMMFLISIGGFTVLVINFIVRWFVPVIGGAPP